MVFVITNPPEDDGGGSGAGSGSTSPTTASAIAVKLAAGTKTAVSFIARDAANTPHSISEAWLRTTSGLKQVFAGLKLAVSSLTANGVRTNAGTVPVTTTTVTATAVGGSPPYSYLWTRTDGGGHPWTISSPTTRATAFKTNVAPHTSEVATFIGTATDASETAVPSDTVTATASNG